MEPTVDELEAEGWALIPVGADKRPMIKRWKHYQERRPDANELAQWKALDPPVWGGITGVPSGRIALDFDGEPGRETLHSLGLDPHRSSPNGGFHVDIEAPPWKVSTVNGKVKRLSTTSWPASTSPTCREGRLESGS